VTEPDGHGPILALDTATELPGVALGHGGRVIVRPIGWRASFRESAPAARALLDQAGVSVGDLAAVAVPAGPGSFTGLRIGATLAVALSRAAGIPLSAVPTLEAVAEAFAPPEAHRVCAVLDARRGRWYAALADRDAEGWKTTAGPADLTLAELDFFAGDAPIVGLPSKETGAPTSEGPEIAPIAAAVVRLVARDVARYAVDSPAGLRLVYARSGVER
jgi:tRNA threonylcarbamoyl adenosine modification protein YeaZ